MRHTIREVQRDQTRHAAQQQNAKSGVSGEGEESEAGMEGYLQFKRWEDFMGPRVFPSGDISLPSSNWDRFQDYLNHNPTAMQMYQQGNSNTAVQHFNGPNTTQSSSWTFAGPTGAPTGGGAGRVGFIRVDPTNSSNLWIGAPAGGLWKSTNGGASWSTNTDFLTVIGASDVAIDPTNTQNMYLATGDGDAGDTYSIGVLKSTDGGTTWNTTGLTWTVNQGRTINKLLMNPTNPLIVIAFSNSGIWRTANGGTTWTQELAVSMKDAEFMPGTPNTVYACGTTFYKSTDGGVTWTNITTGVPASANVDRLAIAVTAANAATIYMIAGSAANDGFYGFYKSTNSGTSFTQVTVSSPSNLLGWASAGNDTGGQGWYDLQIDASPTNANEVCVGGVNIWRTTNGGTSWTLNAHWTGTGAPYVHADQHAMMYLNGTTMFEGCDGGVFKTTNNGGAWLDISANLCIAEIYRIGLSGQAATPNYWISGHQDNGTNLKNGAAYSQTMGGDGMDCFVDRTTNNTMYGEQYQGSLNRTTNGGTTWTAITTGLTGTAPWVTPWHQDPTTANTIYCGRTGLWKSTNQGTSWTQTTAAVPGAGTIVDFKIAPSNNQVIYVVKSNAVYKTVNGGGAWTTITGTLPVASAAISRVDVKPSDPLTAIVTFSGYSAGNKVFKTTNGGTSWTNISGGLPNLPCNCVRYDPTSAIDAVYVGCDVGVYYMDNTFGTWQPYFVSLPNVPIDDLEIHAATSKLRAATYGRGVWEVDIYNPGTLPPVAQFVPSPFITCTGSGVNFTDQSSFAPTSWSWTFPSGTPATSTAQNPTGVTWSTPGTYTITLTASNANGSSTTTQVITVLGSQLPPLVEGFEAAQFLPVGWTANNINNDAIFWTQATTGSASAKSAMFDNYNNDVAGARDEMWAPRLNCAAYSTLQMTFDVAYARYDATYSDSLEVLYSTNCGSTWTSVYLKGGTNTAGNLATAPDQTASIFVPTAAQWRNETVNLNGAAGQSSVLIIFRNRGHYGQAIYVDNINITGTAAATPSATFTASTLSVCAGTPVNFTDNSSGSPTSWTWTFPSGVPASAVTQNVTGVVWNTAGTYTVTHTATNAAGTGTTTQVVTVNALPVVTTTTTGATICSGASTSMTASGATTYNWMPGNLSGATVTVTPAATTTYTVTGTNAAGCTATATRTITVNPTPTVTATAGSPTICSGSSTTLTGTGATTYNWMPGNLSGATVTVTPAATTTYTVTGTSAAGCTGTANVTVTVNPTPTVTTTTTGATICAGSSTTITASGGTTYNWMPGNLSGATVTVTPAATTTYTVTGTTGACSGTATRTITVNPTPTITTTATPATICAGATSTLTASGASTYTWMPGNLIGTPQTVTPGSTTTYTVTGTAANGCTSTATRTVTVNPLPVVTATASSGSICTGNNVTLTGGGASTYNWNPGNHNGSPWTLTPATTTTYTVTGTSAAGCTNTATVTVVVGSPPVVTATATSTSICAGSSTTLTGSGATTYTWNPGAHSGSPWTVTPAATTTYTVTGSTGPGCQSTATIQIVVNALPVVTTSTTGATVCAGSSTTITASGGVTYNWMPGNLSGTTVTVSPATTTTYTVTGTNAAGCTNTATRTITVNPSPTVTTTATSNSICAGANVTLTASGATSYNWMPGNLNGTPQTVTPAATTTYTVTGTAANGCTNTSMQTITVNPTPTVTATASSSTVCSGTTVTLTGSGATTYNWMPGNLNGSPVTDNPVATTTYTVTGTSAGCSGTATVAVTVNPSPTVTATSSGNTVCAGTTITLTGSGATTYNWQPINLSGSPVNDTPLGNTTYTVTGTDVNGCTNTALVSITVNPLPIISISPSSNAICIGSSVNLTGSGAATYAWMPGNLNGTTVTDSPTITTTYTVTGTDVNGCTNTDTASITVYAQPTITVTGNNVICPGGTVTLTGNGGSTYVWQPGGQNTQVITDNPSVATTYTVTGTDVSGCTNTATFAVTIDVPPTTPAITVNGSVLTSTVTGSSYQWFLNGNPISGATSQSYTATGLGSYTVEVYDAAGCGSGQSAAVVDPTGISSSTTGVDFINVLPNPNDGHFMLNFHTTKTDTYILEIHNMLGQVVYSESLKDFSGNYSKEIDLSVYGRGMYTIRLRNSDKETVVKTITY